MTTCYYYDIIIITIIRCEKKAVWTMSTMSHGRLWYMSSVLGQKEVWRTWNKKTVLRFKAVRTNHIAEKLLAQLVN